MAEKDRELQHLRGMVERYEEQVRAMELNNYSLAVHLRQAYMPRPDQRPPDVF